jgi:hypothetical protein
MHTRWDQSGVLAPSRGDEQAPQSLTDPSGFGLGGASNRVGPNDRSEQRGEASDLPFVQLQLPFPPN